MTLEWSPHLLLTILRCLKEVNCSRIIADCGCVFRYFSAPSMTVCDLIGHWIVSADTVGCEPESDPGSRLQFNWNLCFTWNRRNGIRNSGRHTLNLLEWVISCRVTSLSPVPH